MNLMLGILTSHDGPMIRVQWTWKAVCLAGRLRALLEHKEVENAARRICYVQSVTMISWLLADHKLVAG